MKLVFFIWEIYSLCEFLSIQNLYFLCKKFIPHKSFLEHRTYISHVRNSFLTWEIYSTYKFQNKELILNRVYCKKKIDIKIKLKTKLYYDQKIQCWTKSTIPILIKTEGKCITVKNTKNFSNHGRVN